MRVQAYTGSASQKAIATQESSFMRKFTYAKIKKSQSPDFQDAFSFKKDSVNSKTTASSSPKGYGILTASKKIKKTRFTRSKTAIQVNNSEEIKPQPQILRRLRSGKAYLEDGTRQTSNYEKLTYINSQTMEDMDFVCFKDKDLNIPASFTDKLIPHSFDNDCYTEDEQVESSIETLLGSIKKVLQEENADKKTSRKKKN